MKVAKKEDFGLILMSILARNYNRGYIPLSDIAEKSRLSVLFLKQIASLLLKNNLISSKEGINGGYRLTKAPKNITIAQILEAISAKVITTSCEIGDCRIRQKNCDCYHLWDKVNKQMVSYLQKVNLFEFAKL